MTVELLLKELFVVPNEWIVIDITYDAIIFEDEEGNRFSRTHREMLKEYIETFSWKGEGSY